MIDILRIINGTETIVCRVATNDASVVNEIMGREEVTVNITVESPLAVETGDFIRVDGTVYTLNREPDFEKASDVEYRYNLLFESPLYRMLDKLFTNPLTGISKFSVSRTLSEFIRLLTENMNKIDSGWSVSGDIPASEPKNLTFDAVSCREVLNRLSGEFGAEYFLTGKTIHFTERIENKTDLVFEQGKGKGLYSIGQEPVDSENTVTRIFPYGGTQNMTPGKGDASGRLFLPEGYLENFSEYSKVVEKEVEFQDVFPRFTGSADSVSGEFNNIIRCSSINFDVEKQGVGDTKVKINFLSGDLMGESFEFGWNNTNKEVTLIRKEDETALPGKDGKRPLIPHALKKAKSGDSFNFTDLLMPDEYMASAIVGLRAKATEWLAYYSRSRVKYSLEVDHRYLRGKRILKAGDLVTIKIPETGTEKLLRIVSAERNLNTGKLTCTVSNYLDEKWSKKIEGAISDLKSNVTGSGSGGGLKVDILKENDLTPASDLNIYSSKRSVKEIGDRLSRVKADSAEEHITFKKGITVEGGTVTDTLTASGTTKTSDLVVGNIAETTNLSVSGLSYLRDLIVTGLAGVLNLHVEEVATLAKAIVGSSVGSASFAPGFSGEGFKIWQIASGEWHGEFDSITIRKTLTAFELFISKIRAVNGALAITQANGRIKSVADQGSTYKIEIEDTMAFWAGDFIRHQTWKGAESKYYWVMIVRVEGNSVICNKSEFSGVVPVSGDDIVQMGNLVNKARQSMIFLDASSGKPVIDVLSEINSKNFAGKLKLRIGCLDGINDSGFPANMQPSDYGLYCTNAFIKGMLILSSGKTVEDYTDEKVDAVQVGGVNLLDDSEDYRESSVEYIGIPITDIVKENLGKEFTISLDIITPVAGRVLMYSLGVYMTGFSKSFELEAMKFTRIHATGIFNYNPEAGGGDVCTLSFYGTYGTGRLIGVKNIKIEEGNKATGWTPSVNEVSKSIRDAENEAKNARASASTANRLLSDIAADNKFTPSEKQATKKEWDIIVSEKTKNDVSADKYGVSKTEYGITYTALANYITPLLSNLSATSDIVGSAFRTTFKSYYDARTDLLNAVTAKAKELADNATDLALAVSRGKMLYRDPTFKDGRNSTMQYLSNATSSVIVVAGCPNPESKALRIVATGWNNPSSDHRVAGFYFVNNQSRANAVFVVRIVANIPVGRWIKNDHNLYGNGSVTKWLTSTAGTGNWTEYACKVMCAASGTFSTINHFSLVGGVAPTPNAPVVWDVAYATVFDASDVDDVPTRDEVAGLTDTSRNELAKKLGYVNYTEMEAQAALGNTVMSNGKIRTHLIDTDVLVAKKLAAVEGAIGGFNINTYSVFAGGISPSAGVEMTIVQEAGRFLAGRSATDYCTLYNYNANQWGIAGIKNGMEVFHLGARNQIAGWNFDNEAIFTGAKAVDGTYATLGMTIRSNGSISSKNFRIDKDGNVFGKNCEFMDGRFTGTVTATTGRIGGWSIDGNKLTTGEVNGQIAVEISGTKFLRINETIHTLLSIRSDQNTALNISTFNPKGCGIRVLANGDSTAIDSVGSHSFKQRYGDKWDAPGVLFAGRIRDTSLITHWGNGIQSTMMSMTNNYGTYRFTHSLGHSNYIVVANPYYDASTSGKHLNSFVRIENITSSYFELRVVNADNGGIQPSEITFAVIGRNAI